MFFGKGQEFYRPQIFIQCPGRKRGNRFIGKNDFLSHLAAEGADGPFQFTDASFPGITSDDFPQEGVRKMKICSFQPISFTLPGYEVFFCNLYFFFFRISRELDEFHTVKECRRNGGNGVRRGYEKHF